MNIFVTGTTGFLGSYLLVELLKDGYDCFVHVRCAREKDGYLRVIDALKQVTDVMSLNLSRIHIIPGDLTQPLLGLSPSHVALVTKHCDEFIHCAASVRFDLAYDQAYDINVNGTRELLEVALLRNNIAPVKRIDIVSTAYIAGCSKTTIEETPPLQGIRFRNTYEQTKHQAEVYAIEKMAVLPITVFRPSIIVGEAGNGKTNNFNTIYSLLKIYARGQWRILPAHSQTPIDLVTVDYVRDAMLAIRKKPESIGQFYHLTAGQQNVLSIHEIVAIAQKHCVTAKNVIYHPVSLWLHILLPLFNVVMNVLPLKKLKTVLPVLKAYLPYTAQNPQFNDDKTQQILAGSGITSADIKTAIDEVFAYAIACDFGRKPLENVQVVEARKSDKPLHTDSPETINAAVLESYK